jgi:hypothetical protein
MKIRAFLLILVVVACENAPTFLPPPFGPQGKTNIRFFFPTGLAVLPDGSLVVANGNSNHAFDGGTLVSVKRKYLDAFFAGQVCTSTSKTCANGIDDVSLHNDDVFGGAVMIGSYAGPVVLNDAGNVAFTASRDSARLDAVTVNPDLSLTCAPNAGTSTTDCRSGTVDLRAIGVEGPFAIAPGDVVQAGQPAKRLLYVGSITPRIDEIISGTAYTTSLVAAVDMNDPSQVPFTLVAGSRYLANGAGIGPMLFDPTRRQLIMSGCYQRFTSGGAGEPGTGPCTGTTTNYIRFLDVDAKASGNVQLFDMFPDIPSLQTTALILADPDPVTGVPGTLWATMRLPDALVQIDLPPQPGVAPRVRRVVPLTLAPADLVLVSRPGKADLIVVAAEKVGDLAIYDVGEQQIVAEVPNLGDSPFALKVLSNDGVTARLAATVFNSCGIALVSIPLDTPWNAQLNGVAGRCPP